MRSTILLPTALAAFCIAAALPRMAHAAALPVSNQIEQGKQVFAMNCSVGYCHGLEGRAGKGPRLRDREWSRSYLYTTIEKGIPNSSMPSWKGRLPEPGIDAVVTYILSIGRQQPDAETPEAGKQSVPSTPIFSKEAEVGKALFFDPTKDRNCGVCHQVEGSGTAIATAFDKLSTINDQELLRQMLDSPSGAKALNVTIGDGEIICGIKAGETRGFLQIYDLASSGPPVLRTMALGSIRKMEPCAGLNAHQANSHSYSTPELMSIAAFLRSSSGPKSEDGLR